MNDRFFTVLPGPSYVDIFGLDDLGLFTRLARALSWPEVRAIFHLLPAYRRHFTLVVAGTRPPESFLRALADSLDNLVFVPDTWLAGIPRRRARLRARRAARLAAAHLFAPIQTVHTLPDDDMPF